VTKRGDGLSGFTAQRAGEGPGSGQPDAVPPSCCRGAWLSALATAAAGAYKRSIRSYFVSCARLCCLLGCGASWEPAPRQEEHRLEERLSR